MDDRSAVSPGSSRFRATQNGPGVFRFRTVLRNSIIQFDVNSHFCIRFSVAQL